MARRTFAVCSAGLESPASTAKMLAEQGVRCIETGSDFFLNSPADRITEATEIFERHEIWVRSVHAPFGKNCSLSAIDPKKRAHDVETHAELLRKCAHSSVAVIVVHPGTDDAPELADKMLEWCADSLRKLAPVAEETGVRIALENMLPKHPGTTGEQLLRVLDEVNSAYVGVCFDTGHAHCNGDMPGVFERVKDRIFTFHLHDNDGKRDLHYQPPYGTIDWEAFIRIFRTMDWQEPITIEAAPWAGAGYAKMQEQVAALLNHFEERIAAHDKKTQ